MIFLNYRATSLPLNGKSTKELSDQYPNLFVPAALTFSIWGIIYILLTIFSVSYIIKAFKDPAFVQATLNILIAFIITCLLNIAWIYSWHYEKIVLSVIVMILFLVTLIFMFVSQRKFMQNQKLSLEFTIPVQVYLGWISVASIDNITALLVHFKWNGFRHIPANLGNYNVNYWWNFRINNVI